MPLRARFGVAFVVLLCAAVPAHALRVMTYNVLNYNGISNRTTALRAILTETQPDVLVLEEVTGDVVNVNTFKSDILDVVNPGQWAAGPFTNGPDTDNAIFYRSAKCTLLTHFTIPTATREIDEWTLREKTHTSSASNFRLYAVHLHASQGTTNENLRLGEVQNMRTRMETFAAGGNYAVLGDFNIYQSSEPAFGYMTNAGNGAAGVVSDPINRLGNWHDGASFADVHTQSPRDSTFGGGAAGGLDDRFDLILASPAWQDGEGFDILTPTYNCFGQDGQHFNGALNEPPYIVVTQQMAQYLHDASDHLPVYADFQLPALLLAQSSFNLGTAIVGGAVSEPFSVGNAAVAPADELDYSFSVTSQFSAPGGSFQLAAGAGTTHNLGMHTSSAGNKSGTLTISSDDPDKTAFHVALSGTVLDHAQPSADENLVQLVAPLDFGSVAEADTIEAIARIYDVDFGPLRSPLQVYAANLTGDPRFEFVGGFAPQNAAGSPAEYTLRFAAGDATVGVHAGTVVFQTRDLPGPPGAIDRADVQFDLTVLVTSDQTDAPVLSAVIHRTGFVAVRPNPFREGSEIRFALAHAVPARLLVVDVTGRAVRTLVDGALPIGEHGVTWDGRDANGRDVAPGIYFVRMTADGVAETRKVARIR